MTEQEIFEQALDKHPDEWSAFLDLACGADARLRQRVEALLRSHTEAQGFMALPAVEQLAAADLRPEPAAADLSFLAPSSEPDSLGRLDHYEVLEVVGCGGMGVVLRARDTKLHRVVALKVLAAPLAASGSARQRFAREARAAAAVRDEHVVAIHAVCDHARAPYLVMEFVEGSDLETLLRRNGPLDVKEILRIGFQVAQGLAAAHKQGLVHRDVKPANILLENSVQRVKLTDFGLARAVDDANLTQSGLIAGTPLYMSPEQAAGEPIDHRADLFSLGSVLYAMCAGRPAFRAASTLAVIRRVCDEAPRPIREVNPDVPECLCQIIEHLHAKKPADRPSSAMEVAERLAALLADANCGKLPRSDEHASLPLPQRRVAPARHSWLWAAAALVLLFVGLGLGEATGVTDVSSSVIRLLSPEGTLVVEVESPGVNVTVDGSDVVISGAGPQELRLKPGQYKVQASKDGQVMRQEIVTVESNGRRVVRISKESNTLAAASAWQQSVAALPPAEQIDAVVRRLIHRNPGFDGQVTPSIRDGVVTGLRFKTDMVHDISPLRALTHLEWLDCSGSVNAVGRLSDLSPLRELSLKVLLIADNSVSDLSPLQGMPLQELYFARNALVEDLSPLKGLSLTLLDCSHTRVSDLSPLQGMRLKVLWCDQTLVSDLSPLRGMPLQDLAVPYTRVSDISPLAGMPLQRLLISHTSVSDLSPLAGMPLTDLRLAATRVTDLSPLQGMPLRRLGYDFQPTRDTKILRSLASLESINDKPAADFWQEVDGK